jgi:hypothetical protein
VENLVGRPSATLYRKLSTVVQILQQLFGVEVKRLCDL